MACYLSAGHAFGLPSVYDVPKRANGFEPSTFSLEGGQVPTEAPQSQELTSASANACTNACTKPTDSEHSDAADGPDAGPVGEHFAEAVAMLARLPLTDAERAEAVRRLLAGSDTSPAAEGDTP